jgi:hypothetical protein
LLAAVRRLCGRVAIISTNVPLKRNGLPYADGRVLEDPGIAVYWVRDGRQEVMACDRWLSPRENMQAIYHAIEGLRSMERAGATQIMERAFQAFQLPANGVKTSWRTILGDAATREEATKMFRQKALKLHPDVGGDVEAFRELEAAYRAAHAELAG